MMHIPNKWWVLAAMASSISMIFLDQTVLPVALPTIRQELNISELGMHWVINAYLLALTTLVLAGGRLGDMLGHRKTFSMGLLIFSLASAMCGLSQSVGWFILSRALQGVGGALIIPTTPAILLSAFPIEQRGKAFGIYIGIGAFFLSLGPMIGGLFTQYLTWRYVFWINLPIAAIGLLLTYLNVPRSKKKIEERFDFLGFFTIAIGITCLVMALMQGRNWGWTSWPVLSMGITGIFLIVLLAVFDRKVKDPFLDFRLFKSRGYVAANLFVFSIQLVLMLTVFWAIYFQDVLNYSPSVAGLWSMLANSPVIIFSTLSGHLVDRYGPKLPISLGFLLVVAALAWFIYMPSPPSFVWLLPLVLPFGCGVPLILIPSFTLSMQQIPTHRKGVALGINATLRQLSSTLGMAIFGMLFLSVQETKLGEFLANSPQTSSLHPSSFEGLLSKAPHAVATLDSLPRPIAMQIQEAFRTFYIEAFTDLNILGLGIALIALILVFVLLRWGRYTIYQK